MRYAGWAVVAATLGVFLALAAPERLPVVDLSQHARMMSQLVGSQPAHPDYDIVWRPLAHYQLFYWLAALFHVVTSAYTAAKLSFALLVAAILPACAFWLKCAERPVWYALLVTPILFAEVVSWGLVGLVSAVPLFCLCGAFAERLIRHERSADAYALAGLLVVAWFAHLFGWVLSIGLVSGLFVLRRPPLRLLVAPAVALALTALLAFAFASGVVETPFIELVRGHRDGGLGFHPERLLALRDHMNDYGVQAHRGLLVDVALVLLIVVAALGRWRAGLWNLRYPIALLGFLAVIVVASDRFFLYRRFSLYAWALLPLALPAPGRARAAPWLAGALAVVSLLLSLTGFLAGRTYSERVSCIDTLADDVGHDGEILGLMFQPQPEGYPLPVFQHLFADLALAANTVPYIEFATGGYGPLVPDGLDGLYSPGIISLHINPTPYRPAIGRRFETILTSPPIPPEILVGGDPRYRYETCGDFGVVTRTSTGTN